MGKFYKGENIMTTIESMADRMVELADGLSTLQKLEIRNHLLLKVNSDEWDELSFDDETDEELYLQTYLDGIIYGVNYGMDFAKRCK